jgi:RNA polymerase sigma-70 factor (ECF subfamily)
MAAPLTPDDARLAAMLRSGNERAFEEIFFAYHAPLCTFVFRLVGSREVAEEIVQSVFLDLWLRRQQLVIRTSVRALLYRSARNRAIDNERHLAVARRWADDVELGDMDAEPVPDAQQRLESEEREQLIRSAIEILPPRTRTIVLMRWQQGMRLAEIAEVLGISVKGVEIQITRALRALRASLGVDVRLS